MYAIGTNATKGRKDEKGKAGHTAAFRRTFVL